MVTCLAAGGVVYARTRPSTSPFVTTSVRYGTILDTVLVAGTLQPTQTWNLNFPAPGVVTTVNVSPGQPVTDGQLLATIDPASLQAQLTQAQANLTIAQAKLTLAETTSPPPPAAQITIDQADISIAQAAVISAQSAVNSTRLTAPAAAVVAEINISAGQADGASNARAVAASPDIVLESLSAFEVTASISDSQIAQVHVGQAALVVPAGQVTPLPGTVSEITPLASIVQGVAAFPVDISVTGDPPGLFAGASAQVGIVVQHVSHVLTVPASTVHGGGSGRTYVLVVRDGKAVKQTATIGATDTTLAQVSSGLTLGERVVIAQADKPLPTGSAGLFGRKGGGVGGAKGRRGGKAGGGIP
ncbi:MAG: efflux RND transporter periplasmic adaptor subunit [Candidatus Dormibacteria bacterium]